MKPEDVVKLLLKVGKFLVSQCEKALKDAKLARLAEESLEESRKQ